MIDPFQLPWPAEILAEADAAIESTASTYDAITVLPGIGDVLRETWAAIRPRPLCDCPMDPYHRWNCPLTPIWAQTIRELDCNPWGALEAVDTILAWGFPTMCPICNFNTGRECVPAYNDPICTWCWQLNRHREPELWHCADCGEFVSDGKRMQVVEAGAVVIVCPEHFAGRAEAEA